MTHMYFSACAEAAYRTAISAAQILVFVVIVVALECRQVKAKTRKM